MSTLTRFSRMLNATVIALASCLVGPVDSQTATAPELTGPCPITEQTVTVGGSGVFASAVAGPGVADGFPPQPLKIIASAPITNKETIPPLPGCERLFVHALSFCDDFMGTRMAYLTSITTTWVSSGS